MTLAQGHSFSPKCLLPLAWLKALGHILFLSSYMLQLTLFAQTLCTMILSTCLHFVWGGASQHQSCRAIGSVKVFFWPEKMAVIMFLSSYIPQLVVFLKYPNVLRSNLAYFQTVSIHVSSYKVDIAENKRKGKHFSKPVRHLKSPMKQIQQHTTKNQI